MEGIAGIMDSTDPSEDRKSSLKKHRRDKKRKFGDYSTSNDNKATSQTINNSSVVVVTSGTDISQRLANTERHVNNSNEQSPLHEQNKKKPKQEQNTSSTTASRTAQPGSKPSSLWNFAVDYNDHFETPPIAYKDIAPVLEALSSCLNKSSQELTIYDPYWCEGSMVSHLHNLGYENVINRNRDFYMDIKKKNIPEYDILVTNPPYSGEHKVSLLKFLATHTAKATSNNSKTVTSTTTTAITTSSSTPSTLPFALLLPVYTATKSYWKDFAAAQALVGKNAFYVLPPDYYEYSHPEGTGKDIPPFYSAWFLGGFDGEQKTRILQSLRTKPRASTPATVKYAIPLKRLSFNTLTVAESVEALVSRGVVTDVKRPNPKQRQKMKLKK